MLELIQHVIAVVLLIALAWIVWESSKMIQEKKERHRKGISDYYDNPIKKKEDNETIS